jgi:hypothetical protein
MVLGDADHGLANGSGHAGPRALRTRACTSIAAAEADRTSKLPSQKVTLERGLCGALVVREHLRFLDVVVDLLES